MQMTVDVTLEELSLSLSASQTVRLILVVPTLEVPSVSVTVLTPLRLPDPL
jgi:hypothetical protein